MEPSGSSIGAEGAGSVAAGTNSGIVSTGDGAVNIQAEIGAVHIRLAPAAHSAYQHVVDRLAPRALIGRDPELAELARFCSDPAAGPYAWWRGPAWTGKSALMAWFVQHPPSGVQVISFFITARFPGQADRRGFAEVLLEQLSELLGSPLPANLSGSTRDAHLLDLLHRAAAAVRDQNERLVLVVDGLDEDRGVTPGADAYSIAALLPAEPPHGMRIIVSGRADPPLPADLPDDHPLRADDVRTTLRPSPHARAVRGDMERELQRLLDGSDLEQDLLGLITVAGGGLTESDLAELTGSPRWRVSRQLDAVSGRTFARWPGTWRPAADVIVLGHEELQAKATEYLSGRESGYRQRIHAWADGYREQGWPDDTPEYLLRTYFEMLRATGDTDRVLRYAADRTRHDRMLEVSGGDGTALGEVGTAQRVLLEAADVDLPRLARLAAYRGRLLTRNRHLSWDLPALWALLGAPQRAEAMLGSITKPTSHTFALMALARSAGEAGAPEQAWAYAERAVASTRWIAEARDGDRMLCSIVGLMSEIGAGERAGELARAIVDPHARSDALSLLSESTADAGDRDRAEQQARSVPLEAARSRALAMVTEARADAGEFDAAVDLAEHIPDPYWRAHALTSLAGASAAGDRAPQLVLAGEQAAGDIKDGAARSESYAWLATVPDDPVRRAGLLACADEAVPGTEFSWAAEERTRALTEMIRAAAASDDLPRAEALVDALDEDERDAGRLAVVEVLVPAGDIALITSWIARMTDGTDRAWAQCRLAEAIAEGGDLAGARSVLSAIGHPITRGRAEVEWALRLATADLDGAAAVITSAEPEFERVDNLIKLARLAAGIGEPGRAQEFARAAERLARRTVKTRADFADDVALAEATARAGRPDVAMTRAMALEISYDRDDALVKLFSIAGKAGDLDHAEAAARAFSGAERRSELLADLAALTWEAGRAGRARALLGEAWPGIRAAVDSSGSEFWPAAAVELTARMGDIGVATERALSITAGRSRDGALHALIGHRVDRGEIGPALDLLPLVGSDSGWRTMAQTMLVEAVAPVDPDRARALAGDIGTESTRAAALGVVARHSPDPEGDLETAISTATSAGMPISRVEGLLNLAARVPARAGDLLASVEALLSTDAGELGSWTSRLCADAAGYGFGDRAATWLRQFVAPHQASEAWIDLIQAAGRNVDSDTLSGWIDEGVAALDKITETPPSTEGSIEFHLHYRRSRTMSGLARAAAAAGRLDLAESLAARVPDAEPQGEALTGIARAALAYDVSRAIAVAGRTTDPALRAAAFCRLAEQAGAADARRLLGHAFLDDWKAPLQTLAGLDAAAALAFVEEYDGNEP